MTDHVPEQEPTAAPAAAPVAAAIAQALQQPETGDSAPAAPAAAAAAAAMATASPGGDRPPRGGRGGRNNGRGRARAEGQQALAGQPAPSHTPLRTHPALEQLAGLYPHLFGAVFLPLKRGIFQDLLEAHPKLFERDALKVALGIHTRSTRYLQSVAAGEKRHDLAGQPVEDMAPEHVHHALLELFRRRNARANC
jgi:hypothetical protein